MVLFWVSLLALPDYAYDVRLDGSWELALARLLRSRAQAGVDYIFTYGPLGYFYTTAYDAELFAAKCAWEAGVKLAMALAFASVVLRLRNPLARVVFCLGVVTLLGPQSHSMRDTLYPLFVAVVTLALCRSRQGAPAAVAYGLLLATLALVKFSFFVLAALCLPVVGVVLAATGRRAAAVLASGAFVVGLASLWLVTGQAPANFGAFLQWSVIISAGFNQAMALAGDLRQVGLALATLGLLTAGFVADARRLPRLESWPLTLLLTGILFLQWKQGFTRQDDLHVEGFFGFTLLLPFALAAWLPPPAGQAVAGRLLLLGTVVLSLVGLEIALQKRGGTIALATAQAGQLPGRAEDAFMPWRLAVRLDRPATGEVAKYFLPSIKARVGDAGVDLLLQNQGVVFLNDMRWRPRPVFQSYSAYTPALQEENARFFRSDRAPRYVLYHLVPIDARFPATEDSQALLEILRRYHPVLVEKGFLLLEQNDRAPPDAAPEVVRQWSARFGEPIPVADAGEYQTLAVDVRPTARGRLRALLHQPATLLLEVTTVDGGQRLFRLVPSLSAEAFLLSPLLGEGPGILGLYGSPGAVRVRSVRVLAPGSAADDYEGAVRVTLTARPRLVPDKLDAGALGRLAPCR